MPLLLNSRRRQGSKNLSEGQKAAIIILREINGLTFPQIATKLGITDSTAGKAFRRAKRKASTRHDRECSTLAELVAAAKPEAHSGRPAKVANGSTKVAKTSLSKAQNNWSCSHLTRSIARVAAATQYGEGHQSVISGDNAAPASATLYSYGNSVPFAHTSLTARLVVFPGFRHKKQAHLTSILGCKSPEFSAINTLNPS
ncbi:hypothetical protein K504DRAFT_452426 [Pleomassaria siparia CBS 279.74]|uniref:RNA polymerase sigma factor 70 region 4 type 2 domain-containing protein n=1 Tax=Pleomassaria siparia CBS 279.74 TaxID=1314801 RepID=A0A6G1KH78_9PLEO|nr:hypothetical protein K504DRAFT_452426 [Pleomassaria siparia CBS 279.74]